MNYRKQAICLVVCLCAVGVRAGDPGLPEDQGGGSTMLNSTAVGHTVAGGDVEECRALLRSARQSGERWFAFDQAHILIRKLRKQRDADCAAFLRSVVTNTTVPDYVRAEAVGTLYHVTGDVQEAMAWAKSDNDRMRGVAIEALAPDLLGDPQFDAMIEALKSRGRGEVRTSANNAIRSIIWIKWFRKEFAAKPDAEAQIGLVMGVLGSLCPERPNSTGAPWYIGTDAISQDVLRKLKELHGRAPEALRAALERKVVDTPQMEPLVALVLDEIRGAGVRPQ